MNQFNKYGDFELSDLDELSPQGGWSWRDVAGALIAIALMSGFFSLCIIAGTRLWKR